MKSRAIALTVAALVASACADNRASIEFGGICGVKDPSVCAPSSGTCDKVLADRPYLYLLIPTGTVPILNENVEWMEFDNRLSSNADASSGRLNTNNFMIEEYRLSYSSAEFSIPETGYPANAPIVPADGSATALVHLVPLEAASMLEAELTTLGLPYALVTVELKVKGRFGDDSTYVSAPFRFPIDVYRDAFGGYSCPVGERVTAVCPNIGQDASVACSTPVCAGANAGCALNTDCCSGMCNASLQCACAPSDTICTQNSDCCSGVCNKATYTCT